jgi:hypothetical protein
MLGSWLHGVALRIALRAKRAGIRRRKHEQKAATMPPEKEDSELSWREVRQCSTRKCSACPRNTGRRSCSACWRG